MKRSEINEAILKAKQALSDAKVYLPSFADWSADQWRENLPALSTIRAVMLGWDVTDFGGGDFAHVGAVLFTLRNGDLYDSAVGVPYCEKVIVFDDAQKQVIPLHMHRSKTEDIINRGGGVMEIELFNSAPDGALDPTGTVTVYMDGLRRECEAGRVYEILPGSSITLTPGMYHRFGGKQGAGMLVAGEVSKINDDNADNIFAQTQSRFSTIEEDAPALHPLCNEYDRL